MKHTRPLAVGAAALALTVIPALLATGHPAASVVAAGATDPVVSILHIDRPLARQAASAPLTRASAQAAPATAYDVRFPKAPPTYRLPEALLDSCDSQSVPHPSGFGVLGGSGHATFTHADGSSVTYTPAARHVPLQVVCLNATSAGDLELDIVVQAVSGDSSIYHVTVGPSGLVVLDVAAGKLATPVPVHERLGAWPGGCGHLTVSGASPGNATLDDTLCFSPSGQLTHIDAHEHSTDAAGTRRDLEVSLDSFPNG